MLKRCSKWFPPGYAYEKELLGFGVWLGGSLVYSFGFFLRYWNAYERLFVDTGRGRILIEGRKIEPFWELLGNSLLGFAIAILMLLTAAVWHYLYYFQGSRSILLMRGLPDKWYLVKSCVSGPVLGLLLCLGLMALLYLCCYGFYLRLTPESCLPVGEWRGQTAMFTEIIMGGWFMLKISGLNQYYRELLGWKHALKNINLQLPQGEIIGLFGENGAGKTTLLKCILGLVPYQGSITLDGEKIDRKQIHRLSFATCEHSFFPNLTPKQHSEFYRMHFPNFREKRFEGLMDFFDLPAGKALKQYSTGQKNQFEVILSLCQGADYILMDEPFSGNDIFNREDFYKVLLGILEPSETILLSTHLIEEVEHFIGRALFLRQGELVGDVNMLTLEDEGLNLTEYMKELYHYRGDHASKGLGVFD